MAQSSTPVPPRIRLPSGIKAGDMVEIKTLIAHEMESGFRKDAAGNLVPRRILNGFEARFDGEPVFRAQWQPAISANPFQTFFLRATRSGKLDFAWTDDDGTVVTASAMVNVG